MEYIAINEEFDSWKDSWQESKFVSDLNERQRERDFREGYIRGFEKAILILKENKNEDLAH